MQPKQFNDQPAAFPPDEPCISHDALEYYARRAPEYESIYDRPERQADLLWLGSRLSELFAGRDVLELACGTGYWTKCICRCARSVLATDISEESLQIARAKEWGNLPVAFEVADAWSLEMIPGSFDAAFAGFLWSHIDRRNLSGFLGRLTRRLAPGALVAFVDNRFVAASSTPFSRSDEAGNTYQLRTLVDGSRYEILKNCPTEVELLAGLHALDQPIADEAVELCEHFWLLTCRTARE